MLLDQRPVGPVERVLFLRRIPGLANLPATDLALLGEYARERFSPRGTVLLRDGEPVREVHFVLDGRVRLKRRGRELGLAGPASAVGARLLLARDDAGLEAVADTDAVTLALDRESFLDALEERFEIFRGVLRETCRELVDLLVHNPLEAAPQRPLVEPPPLGGGALDLVHRILLLRSQRPFDACSIDALAELAQRVEEARFPAGTVFWKEGDRPSRMLLLAGGRVRCQPAEGAPAFTVGPGQGLGALEILAETPRWYEAVVEEPVLALSAEVEQLLDVLEDNVDMALQFLSYLARTSVGIQERVAEREGSLSRLFGCEGKC